MPAPPPADIGEMTPDDLRRAVDLYLAIAYPSGAVPEAVRRRLEWPERPGLVDLIEGAPFERASKAGSPPVFSLRLGNARYPHMKLQVQPWAWPSGFLLSVNTHDQILGLDPKAPDAEAFRALQEENARIKEAIETAWDSAGLPTFLRYLRVYLDTHPGMA